MGRCGVVWEWRSLEFPLTSRHDDLARLLNELAALGLEEPESRVCENVAEKSD